MAVCGIESPQKSTPGAQDSSGHVALRFCFRRFLAKNRPKMTPDRPRGCLAAWRGPGVFVVCCMFDATADRRCAGGGFVFAGGVLGVFVCLWRSFWFFARSSRGSWVLLFVWGAWCCFRVVLLSAESSDNHRRRRSLFLGPPDYTGLGHLTTPTKKKYYSHQKRQAEPAKLKKLTHFF